MTCWIPGSAHMFSTAHLAGSVQAPRLFLGNSRGTRKKRASLAPDDGSSYVSLMASMPARALRIPAPTTSTREDDARQEQSEEALRAHRERVRASTEWALVEHASTLEK